ncbi:phage holin [Mesobacillus stamsii]|uniref:SPP1 family holin n=1 Tax=Mesobacillus stamsii TaxID=225347 RepID=A0ABU0FXA5_9BACI|nr:phage holin [Mesobacillus stamsii]MDQ0414575.1 SPP1 family holin [Mesobacillus stamsii]
MNNFDKGTVIRTVLLFVALLNQVLIAFGKAPVSLNEQQIGDWYMVISTLVTGVIAAWSWFKNNYITKKGQLQKEALLAKGLTKK